MKRRSFLTQAILQISAILSSITGLIPKSPKPKSPPPKNEITIIIGERRYPWSDREDDLFETHYMWSGLVAFEEWAELHWYSGMECWAERTALDNVGLYCLCMEAIDQSRGKPPRQYPEFFDPEAETA